MIINHDPNVIKNLICFKNIGYQFIDKKRKIRRRLVNYLLRFRLLRNNRKNGIPRRAGNSSNPGVGPPSVVVLSGSVVFVSSSVVVFGLSSDVVFGSSVSVVFGSSVVVVFGSSMVLVTNGSSGLIKGTFTSSPIPK